MFRTRPVAVILALLSLAGCVSPALPGSPPVLRWVPNRVTVKFKNSADHARVEQARVRIGARSWERLPMSDADLLSLDGSLEVPAALERLGDFTDVVEYAEPDFLFDAEGAPSDYDPSLLWGLAKIDAPDAWLKTEGSATVIVALLDTGIDGSHADLTNNLWTNPDETIDGIDQDGDDYVDDLHGWNFVDGTPDPIDDDAHGTHVAGTIGAVGRNGGIVGVSPMVSLMALKTLGPDGGTTSDAIRAIAFARAHGARIINASWGGRGYSSALKSAIQKAGNDGILFVAAAGNGDDQGVGQDADRSPVYPAAFALANVVSVAATDSYDRLAEFSNYGVTTVDLAAPGVGIVSTIPGGRYARYDGTSMATPHVSGVAALMLALEPTLSVAELKAALIDSAAPVAALRGRVVAGGRLDAAAALDAARAVVRHRAARKPT